MKQWLLIALLVWLGGCSSLPPADLISPTLDGVKVSKLGLGVDGRVHLQLAITVSNPNDWDIPISAYGYKITVLDQVLGSDEREVFLDLPALDSIDAPVNVVIDPQWLPQLLQQSLLKGGINAELTGYAIVNDRRFPFSDNTFLTLPKVFPTLEPEQSQAL